MVSNQEPRTINSTVYNPNNKPMTIDPEIILRNSTSTSPWTVYDSLGLTRQNVQHDVEPIAHVLESKAEWALFIPD